MMTGRQTPELIAQYNALTENAGFCDVSNRTRIELTGADRVQFLHNLCTNDIRQLEPGAGCEAFVTNVQGKIVGHIFVSCRAECLLIDTVADQGESLAAHFDKYLIREDVQIIDRSAVLGELLACGRHCSGLLLAHGIALPTNNHANVHTRIGGQNVCVARADLAGEPTFLISADFESIGRTKAWLESNEFVAAGEEALDVVRVEHGFPWYGRDITDRNLPQEVGRDQLSISFTKGCYLGQETVARIDALGHVNRKLAAIRIPELEPPHSGTEIRDGDKTVGSVTSAVYSPRLQCALALAYIRSEHGAIGHELSVLDHRAEVVEVPLSA